MKSLARVVVLSLALVLWSRSQSMVAGQVVVFLPEYSQFRVNSSFFVPDGGSLYQGGVSRFSQGSTNRGVPGLSNIPGAGRLLGNRSIGGSTSTSGVVTTARIYNMRDIGEGILAGTHDQYGNLIRPSRTSSANSQLYSTNDLPADTNWTQREFSSAFSSDVDGTGLRNGRVEPTDRWPSGGPDVTGAQDLGNQRGRGQAPVSDIQRRAQFLKRNLGRNQ